MSGRSSLLIGVHPTSKGFGWMVFEEPSSPYDWGIAYVRSADKNAACLRHLRTLFQRHRPETLVLEQFDSRSGKRTSRVGQLIHAAMLLADEFAVEVRIYRRRDVTKALQLPKGATRQDVAEKVVQALPILSHRLPTERRPWEGSDRRMALFCAAALVLTHFSAEGDWTCKF